MRARRKTIMILLLLGVTGVLFAQSPAVHLEYYENASRDMYVRLSDGKELGVDEIGMGGELPVGATLVTLDGDYAELRMQPTGTILRVSENTNFTVNGLQGRDAAAKNTFTVAVGKIRAVVAKRDGSQYAFRGDSAVCGVRGTQFFLSVLPTVEELAYVVDGVIDYTNAAGQTISVGAGLAANALAANFQTFTPPPGILQSLQQGMDFVQLRMQEVQGYLEEAAGKEAAEEKPTEVAEAAEKGGEGAAGEAPAAKSEPPAWLQKLMNVLGMEIGTVTIDDQTWAKAIIQPRFTLGKLKVALYLPVIYQQDMLDPETWYRPDGNDEWSFGTDQSGWEAIVGDAINDLFLKIRYVQYGDNRDPFFFKLGNLDNITLGHGSIMRMYANDADFPSVRKVGLDLGLNKKKGGLQLMIDDAGNPQIFGLRGYVRPIGKLGLGLSAVTDIDPQREAGDDLMFLNGGADLDLPIIEKKRLSIVAFADVAAMVPYFRTPVGSIPEGFAWDAVWYDGKPRNWGLDAGLLGNLLMIDYRLEFQWSNGIFRPAFYDNLYDRLSGLYADEMIAYLSAPSDPIYDTYTMGVYGELGYELPKVFYLKGGYLWPWPTGPEASSADWPDDQLWLEFGIFKDLLPLYGSISMTRRGLAAPLIRGESVDFFDENLVFSGELDYPFSPLVELALVVTTNVVGGKAQPSVSILTRLSP
jgi:hypothetical protein